MKLSIQLEIAELSISNTVLLIGVFGINRVRSTVHNWIHKIDLRPESDRSPTRVAVAETVIQLEDKRYWLYAAVDLDSNVLLYTKLETARTNVIADQFFADLRKKHDVDDAIFLVDGAVPLHRTCEKHGLDFRYERHGNQHSADICFSR